MITNLDSKSPRKRIADDTPDLMSQLEGLLDAVWVAEKNWRLDDRIDLALGEHRPTDKS